MCSHNYLLVRRAFNAGPLTLSQETPIVRTAARPWLVKSPQTGRRDIRPALFYRAVYALCAIPTGNILVKADERTHRSHPYKFRHIPAITNTYRQSFFPRTIPGMLSLWGPLCPLPLRWLCLNSMAETSHRSTVKSRHPICVISLTRIYRLHRQYRYRDRQHKLYAQQDLHSLHVSFQCAVIYSYLRLKL